MIKSSLVYSSRYILSTNTLWEILYSTSRSVCLIIHLRITEGLRRHNLNFSSGFMAIYHSPESRFYCIVFMSTGGTENSTRKYFQALYLDRIVTDTACIDHTSIVQELISSGKKNFKILIACIYLPTYSDIKSINIIVVISDVIICKTCT